jgi:type IV pilus assembly protein PilM
MAAVGTGVTIGSRSVRVLQVRKQKSGEWQVTRALISHIADEDPSDGARVGEARAALNAAQVKGRGLVGVSGRDLIVRYTHVPPVPDWRLEMLMNFEIQEVSEQSGGDVSAAYALLDVDDSTTGDNVVVVALAKNGYLKPRLAALKGAGLDAMGGTPRAVGAYWSYKENGRLRHDETVVIMHIGHENTDVAVARQGTLLFARNVAGGSKKFTDALVGNMRVNFATAEKLKANKGNLTPRGRAKYRDSGEEKVANNLMGVGGHFVSAVNSSVMFAKAQTKVPDCSPDRVVLMGAGALLRGLPEYLESNLGVPVELFDPLDEVDLSTLPDDQRGALQQQQGAMAVALGLAQMAAEPEGFQVSVLPDEDRKRRAFLQHTLFTLIAGAVLAVGLIVAFVLAGGAHDAGSKEKTDLGKLKELYVANEQEYDRAHRRVEIVNDQKYRLRNLVALGPAFEIITHVVQEALATSPTGDEFGEIFIQKVSADMGKLESRNEKTGDLETRAVPEVVFEASIKPIGARAVQNAYSQFVSTLKQKVRDKGYLEFREVKGGLRENDSKFGFRILQVEFPERWETEAAKKDDS